MQIDHELPSSARSICGLVDDADISAAGKHGILCGVATLVAFRIDGSEAIYDRNLVTHGLCQREQLAEEADLVTMIFGANGA